MDNPIGIQPLIHTDRHFFGANMQMTIRKLAAVLVVAMSSAAHSEPPATSQPTQPQTVSPQTIRELSDKAAASTDARKKAGFIDELLKIDSDIAAKQVAALLKTDMVLSAPHGQPSGYDAEIFRSIPSPAMRAPLVQLLEESTGKDLFQCRLLVAGLLARSGDPKASSAIGRALEAELAHGGDDYSMAYCTILATLHDVDSVDALNKCFATAHNDVRLQAAASKCLATIGTKEAADRLGKLIFSSAYSFDALYALSTMPPELAVPALIESTANPQFANPGKPRPSVMPKKSWDVFTDVLQKKGREFAEAELRKAESTDLQVSEPMPSLTVALGGNQISGYSVADSERLHLRTKLEAWWQKQNKPHKAAASTQVATVELKTKLQVDALVKTMTSVSDAESKNKALLELLKINDEYAATSLCAYVKELSRNGDSDDGHFSGWQSRWVVSKPVDAPALLIQSPPVFAHHLIQLLQDGTVLRQHSKGGHFADLQRDSIILLSTVRDKAATEEVQSVLTREIAAKAKDYTIIHSCCSVLGVIADPESFSSLSAVVLRCPPNDTGGTVIASPISNTPLYAIQAIGNLRTDDGFKFLGGLLVKGDYHQAALQAMTKYHDKRAIGPLIDALTATVNRNELLAKAAQSNESAEDRKRRVNANADELQQKRRDEVFKALVQLGGPAEFGSDTDKWKQWWSQQKKMTPATQQASVAP